MPIKRIEVFQEGPKGADGKPVPHLALQTTQGGGSVAIPPGALMYIVDGDGNGGDPNNILPVVLKSVSRRRIVFICGCQRPGCTRQFTFEAKWSGNHPPAQRK